MAEIITGVQLLFLTIYILTCVRRTASTGYLALFLGGQSAYFLYKFTYLITGTPAPENIFIYYWGFPFTFFYIPFLYFYVTSFTEEKKFTLGSYLHLLPSLLALLIIPFKFMFNYSGTVNFVEQTGFLFNLPEMLVFTLLEYLQLGVYTVAALASLRRYRRKNSSAFYNRRNGKFAEFIIAGFLAAWFLNGTSFVLHIVSDGLPEVLFYVKFAGLAVQFLCINLIAYTGLKLKSEENNPFNFR